MLKAAHIPAKTCRDYYPFGMEMPGRSYEAGGYRFGFNGKEADPEAVSAGSQYDYGFRIYNAGIGRFLSVDPLTASYPWYSPFQFSSNNPIRYIDLDGLEAADPQRVAAARVAATALCNGTCPSPNHAVVNLNVNEIKNYLNTRLSDPSLESHYNSCGPTSASYIIITHDPELFVVLIYNLWMYGEYNGLVVPDNLRNSDKHYFKPDDIDQLIEGTLRASENRSGQYLLEKPKSTGNEYLDQLRLYATNATLPSEMSDFFERSGATVEITSFRSLDPNNLQELQDWTATGKVLIFFGYFNAMNYQPFNTNPGGGDHFVTVSSIVVNTDGLITLSFWHHGEYSNNGYETKKFTKEQFQDAFKLYSKVTNTGN